MSKAVKPLKRPSPTRGNHPDDPDKIVPMPRDVGPRFEARVRKLLVPSENLVGVSSEYEQHYVVDKLCPVVVESRRVLEERDIAICPSKDAADLVTAALNLYDRARAAAIKDVERLKKR